MTRGKRRVILDTNVLVRGLVNGDSDSGHICAAATRRDFIPVLSTRLLREYKLVLADPPLIARYPKLAEPGIARIIEKLVYVGDVLRDLQPEFEFERDPNDAHLIELCIAGRATHLITTDKDLLTLPTSRKDAGRRFRQRIRGLKIVTPREFLSERG